MDRVIEFHDAGYNCAESIIKAINEEKNLSIPVSIASPFGTGMTVGTTCGAITGALMVLGALNGRETKEEKNNSRQIARVVMNRVREDYGTFECKELKKKGVSCNEIIKYTYDVMKEYIK